jgi:hypothetical protein
LIHARAIHTQRAWYSGPLIQCLSEERCVSPVCSSRVLDMNAVRCTVLGSTFCVPEHEYMCPTS